MNFPEIKNKFALVIAGILLIPMGYFVFDRLQLLHVGKHVVGVVEEVTAVNDTCSERRGKRTYHYSCTRYDARIGFDTLPPPVHSTFKLSGGSTRGHSQPVLYSSRQEGDPTKVIYDPKKLSRAYEDTIWGIWAVPILNFIFHGLFLVLGFTEKRRRNE